ncbi:MAG: hypothetical protein ACPG44_07405 [Polaribacter sp.]
MKKKIMMCFLLLVLLSVAVGCAVKPYSKVIEIPLIKDNSYPNRGYGQSCAKALATPDDNIVLLSTMNAQYVVEKGSEIHVMKINLKGKIQWYKVIEGSIGYNQRMMLTKNNNLLIIGRNNVGCSFLLELDLDGNVVQSIVFKNLAEIRDLVETSNGDFILLARVFGTTRRKTSMSWFRITREEKIVWSYNASRHDLKHIVAISDSTYLMSSSIVHVSSPEHYRFSGILNIINEQGKSIKEIHLDRATILGMTKFNEFNIVIINQYIYAFDNDLNILWNTTNLGNIFVETDFLYSYFFYRDAEMMEYLLLEKCDNMGLIKDKQQFRNQNYKNYSTTYSDFLSIKNKKYLAGIYTTSIDNTPSRIFLNRLTDKQNCVFQNSNDSLNISEAREFDYKIVEVSSFFYDNSHITFLPTTLKIKTLTDFKTKIYNTCDIEEFIYKPITK